MTERFANQLVMILDGGIDDTQNSLAVLDPTGCPASGNFRLAVGPPTGPWELMIGTGRTGPTINVTRHAEGTTATAHGDGEEVRLVLTAAVLADLVAAKLPPGGATGYVLKKQSGTDFDAAWSVPVGATGPAGPSGTPPPVQVFWHEDATILNGNTSGFNIDSGMPYNGYYRQDAPADGDQFSFPIVLAPGTYAFRWTGEASASSGIIDWSIDADAPFEAGQDWYDPTDVANTVKVSATPLVTVLTGAHVLKGTVNGKNGSSADFYIQLIKITATKIA